MISCNIGDGKNCLSSSVVVTILSTFSKPSNEVWEQDLGSAVFLWLSILTFSLIQLSLLLCHVRSLQLSHHSVILPEPFLSLSLFENVCLYPPTPTCPPTLPSYLYSGMCQALDFCDVSRLTSLLLHRKTSLLILARPCMTAPPTDQGQGQL